MNLCEELEMRNSTTKKSQAKDCKEQRNYEEPVPKKEMVQGIAKKLKN